ncbi:MAG: glycoside hydrolase family 95 protein [Breznakibacter sp.]
MEQGNYQRKFGYLWMLAFAMLNMTAMRAEQPPLALWYDRPATEWMTSALPIGNGELGGMFFGGVEREQMQFNEKTLWTGSTTLRGAYQSFGDLYLDFPGHDAYTNYRRELNLDEAMGKVLYTVGGVRYLREYFASYPDGVVVMRISTPGHTGKVTFSVDLKDAHAGSKAISKNTITILGNLNLISYEAQVLVKNEGGTLAIEGSKITVKDADAVTLLLAAGTTYHVSSDTYVGSSAGQLHQRLSKRIARAGAGSYESLKKSHLDDYRSKFNRVKLDLGVPMSNVRTDELVRSHKESIYLDILYFQYGRYLMLSSSRGMDLPNNLQGIWNNDNNPAWQCDIHSNINIQMNYWPAENTNLPECHRPFLRYVAKEALREGGSWQRLARSEGLRGWAVKTQSNIFAYTDWNINRPANAWYCMHLWQHFVYTNDMAYLKGTAFPVMRSACEYWFDRLEEDAGGKLVAPGEWSPEQGPWQDGVAYAQQLVWELFDQTLKASKILGVDDAFVSELARKFEKLDNGLEIGSWGQIKEWKEPAVQQGRELDVYGNDHRHLSQLIALYPGNQISYHLDKELADAARKTLQSRGDEGTGWSRAWKIACWARLGDGDHAYKLLKAALNMASLTKISMNNSDGGVYANLLDAHPPFQIDGNFGATAGIAEMLVQSNLGFIQLLPALPGAWPDGEFRGLRTEGNFTLGLIWKNGQPVGCRVHSGSGNDCKIYCPNRWTAKVTDRSGRVVALDRSGENILSFPTKKGREYVIAFSF